VHWLVSRKDSAPFNRNTCVLTINNERLLSRHTRAQHITLTITLKTRRRTRISVYWSVLSLRVKCRALSLSVLYLVRCLEGITFQIEELLKNQSQKSCVSPTTQIFTQLSNLKYELKIVHNRLDIAVTNLMYHCKYINKFVLLLRKSAVVL